MKLDEERVPLSEELHYVSLSQDRFSLVLPIDPHLLHDLQCVEPSRVLFSGQDYSRKAAPPEDFNLLKIFLAHR
jgi:hypothetical protein